MVKLSNPLAFSSGPVTFVICAVYIAITAALLYTHHVVPPAPTGDLPARGVNLTEAFRDLQTLSSAYHPYNSRQNDVVHAWLLSRIHEILRGNAIDHVDEGGKDVIRQDGMQMSPPPVIVFNDLSSNVSFASSSTSVYFEGTNIMVYIRGSEDEDDDWWRSTDPNARRHDSLKARGVLVNAHYDSVSTGLGATDDGVGVVSILQLIKHYTSPGQQPRRGVVALLNNGEEDYLNGARAFTAHPISRFVDTFLDLEGAGAGGRAILFRATDAEVASKYANSPYPFGNVVASDAFGRGLVRSQTDYVVFNGDLGIRGLDVAFLEPRARYHTVEDSARATSRDSIWHMLSGALATMDGLTADTKTNFAPEAGHRGVWFDIMGRAFGLLTLQELFALTVTLLVVTPIFLLVLMLILQRFDKWYLFATARKSDPLDPHSPDETATIRLGGWKGWTRFPIAVGIASAAVVGLAFLVTGTNPLIVYSSQYAVLSMLLSAWIIVAWFFMRGADAMRPSALHRAHSLGWLFVILWILLVVCAAAENNRHIAGVYFLVICFAAVFVALTLSYLEFTALPRKRTYVARAARGVVSNESQTPRQAAASSHEASRVLSRDDGPSHSNAREDDDATETTSLLGRKRPVSQSGRSRRSMDARSVRIEAAQSHLLEKSPYGDEQKWSGSLPSWLWILQFLLIAPTVLIIVGPLALFTTSALHQTLADGDSALVVYMLMALLSILLLLPLSPFLHRFTSRVPLFLFCVFVGTLAYNLLAFPFSEQNRLKVFFRQDLDVETGANRVSLTGLDGFLQQIIAELPSAHGQIVDCATPELASKSGLVTCAWPGLAPNVTTRTKVAFYSNTTRSRYDDWVSVAAVRTNGTRDSAAITICGRETRACRLEFEQPIADFHVRGSAGEGRGPAVSAQGARELRLWHREWSQPWTVDVRWSQDREPYLAGSPAKGRVGGRAICLWSDDNVAGAIPALDEVRMYMPLWSAVSKLDDGLVMGYRNFTL